MGTNVSGKGGRRRRVLSPSQKYEVFLEVTTSDLTQAQVAAKWGINRSTVKSIVQTARQGSLDALAASGPGRPGRTAEQVELEDAKAEIERLRATVTEQAVELHLIEGKSRWD